MTEFNFETTIRKDRARVVRKAGLIPGVIYGKGFSNSNLALEKIKFLRVLKDAGTSNLINLKIDNLEPVKVLVHDIAQHPVSGEIEHVDFFKVNMKEKIKTEIPLEFVGTSTLVIDQEGSQIINRDNIEVECLPADLVDHIEVDVSAIVDFEQNIKVGDLRVPESIEVISDPEEVVVLIQPPRSEEELEALDEEVVEDVETVEVEEKGKEEEVEGEEPTDEASGEKSEEKKPEKEEKK
jgi:large subunit ribosomal protein L25